MTPVPLLNFLPEKTQDCTGVYCPANTWGCTPDSQPVGGEGPNLYSYQLANAAGFQWTNSNFSLWIIFHFPDSILSPHSPPYSLSVYLKCPGPCTQIRTDFSSRWTFFPIATVNYWLKFVLTTWTRVELYLWRKTVWKLRTIPSMSILLPVPTFPWGSS